MDDIVNGITVQYLWHTVDINTWIAPSITFYAGQKIEESLGLRSHLGDRIRILIYIKSKGFLIFDALHKK